MNDVKRNVLTKLQYLLDHFPVVAIIGPRQSGKTVLAQQIAPHWKYMDLENPQDYERLASDPLFFFEQFSQHVIIDEAQSYPELFQILRGVVDNKRQLKGRFILTGSSSPVLHQQISESLAGRIATIQLGTLKINEYYQNPLSDFYQLFLDKLSKNNLVQGPPPSDLKQVQQVWLRGGYPEPTLQTDDIFYQQWMQNYQDTYIHRDIRRLFPRLNQRAYQRFLLMLSRLSGTIINRSDLARTIEVSEKTIREYLQIADGTFLWRTLPSFANNTKKSIIKMPKGYIRDTGLLHYLLQINDLETLYTHPIIGHSFEAFVIEELLKGLESSLATNWQAYYYRTRAGAEIDLIIKGSFGLLPIEIKYGMNIQRKKLIHMTQFIEEHKLPFGLLINQSQQVEWLTPKIIQIPVGWL